MSEKVNYSDNVGWTLWNYSKRISAVKYEAREAQRFLDSHTKLDDWRIEDLSAMGDLTNQLQDCAERADDTWGKLRDAVNESDADLIEQLRWNRCDTWRRKPTGVTRAYSSNLRV